MTSHSRYLIAFILALVLLTSFLAPVSTSVTTTLSPTYSLWTDAAGGSGVTFNLDQGMWRVGGAEAVEAAPRVVSIGVAVRSTLWGREVSRVYTPVMSGE